MENSTIIPVVSDCRLPPPTYEHEPLWIMGMIVVSAISTLTAMILRKGRARASRARDIARAPPNPLPPLPRERGRRGEEEEETV